MQNNFTFQNILKLFFLSLFSSDTIFVTARANFQTTSEVRFLFFFFAVRENTAKDLQDGYRQHHKHVPQHFIRNTSTCHSLAILTVIKTLPDIGLYDHTFSYLIRIWSYISLETSLKISHFCKDQKVKVKCTKTHRDRKKKKQWALHEVLKNF